MLDQDPKPDIGEIRADNVVAAGNITVAGDVYLGNPPCQSPQQCQSLTPPRKLPSRIDEFVGRLQAIADIHASLARPRNPGVTREHVTHGQGGIGKTSLAVVYAWEHLAEYPCGLFLVDCSSDDFCSAIAGLYPYIFGVQAPDSKHTATNAVRVKHHLESSDKAALLILDDVHNVEHWARLHSSGFLPGGACDHLITTTDPDLPCAQPFPLEPLSHQEGIELLAAYRNDIVSEQDRQSAGVIADWLGGVPFYLSIVGIYMRRNPGLTWQQYSNSLEHMGLDAVRGAEHAGGILPDRYARRVDQVMDTLFDSLSDNERRAWNTYRYVHMKS